MTTTSIFTIAALAGLCIGFAACSFQRKTTGKPDGTVTKVPYADKILLHMHPEKVLNYLPDLKDDQIAYLYGMSLQDYQTAKKEYDDQANKAAGELLKDTEFAQKIDRLPFKKDQTVLVLGESTADALNSWVVILQHLLQQRRPQDNIRIINAAVSGQTTTEALKRITTQLKQNPDWILCHLGANDCLKYGGETLKTNVSIAETLQNLDAIHSIASAEVKNNFVWMAPAPINESKASFFPPFKQMKISVKNDDLLALADSLKQKYGPVIDFRAGFDVPAKAHYMQFDGVHLSLDGQLLIVTTLINHLITLK